MTMSKNKNDNKIVSFPSKSDRKKASKAEEKHLQKQYKAERTAAKHAKNPPMFNFERIPLFTRIFVASIVLIHVVLYVMLNDSMRLFVIYNLGFTPATFTSLITTTQAPIAFSPLALLTPITHIFIHGGWFHLFLNAGMGLALCLFFERAHGTPAAIKFFFLTSLGGALIYILSSPFAVAPVIGASGGISGLFGAVLYTMLHQIQRQPNHYSTANIMNGQAQLRKKAAELMRNKGPWPIIIFWGALMTFFGLISGDNIAWSVHLGGYATGVALIHYMSIGKIKL
jgi:membrane associated rhomboid family serine protease